jgi:hypothetical protein
MIMNVLLFTTKHSNQMSKGKTQDTTDVPTTDELKQH